MGALKKAFGIRSSHSAKKENVWGEIIEALNECTSLEEVESFEAWVANAHWNLPGPYREPLADAIYEHVQSILIDEEILAGRIVVR